MIKIRTVDKKNILNIIECNECFIKNDLIHIKGDCGKKYLTISDYNNIDIEAITKIEVENVKNS